MSGNVLYYGDNLYILREYIGDKSIDLIYLDPPFNSRATYNVLYKEPTGEPSRAQITAFEDTWHWTEEAKKTFDEIVDKAPSPVVEMMSAFERFIKRNDVMAYLTMMCIRLLELKRVLKDTGSIYLHCDPTASHYLKLLMDAVFGVSNYRNEIVWCYEIGGRVSRRRYGRRHDVLLFYSKGEDYMFNWDKILQEWSEVGAAKFRYEDEKGKYRLMGRFLKDSPIKGHRDVNPEWEKTNPELVYRHYMKEGRMCLDYWDIPPINQVSKERLGYPTQKPEALLERIIKASSNEEDVVLDPFCGCGTTIVAAEEWGRNWIGIDITHLAIALIKNRLNDAFGDKVSYKVIGEPVDLSGAHALANQNRYQFQWWALSLVKAMPVDQKKNGADHGVDGVRFLNITPSSKPKLVKLIAQVKSGLVSVAQIREFRTILDNTKAQMGIFITLNKPTRPMITEALSAGYYSPEVVGAIKCPRIQILTVEELLNGKMPKTPLHEDMTYKKAEKENPGENQPEQLDLLT